MRTSPGPEADPNSGELDGRPRRLRNWTLDRGPTPHRTVARKIRYGIGRAIGTELRWGGSDGSRMRN